MEPKKNSRTQRQLFSSYVTTTLSISLVLFVLGTIGLLFLNVQQLSTYVKENIGLTLIIKNDVREAEAKRLQKIVDMSPFVKSTEYVDKERGAQEMKEEFGEDFIAYLGRNPLPVIIKVKLNAQFANPESMQLVEKAFSSYPEIKEIYYQKDLMSAINQNLRKITLILGSFGVILLIISFALINNTIRLMVYSKRFIINTMQLVGATKGFIRKPFLKNSILHGLIGSFISIMLLSSVIYWLQNELEGVIGFSEITPILLLFGMVISFGILITFVSTFLALNKYLKLRTDELYF